MNLCKQKEEGLWISRSTEGTQDIGMRAFLVFLLGNLCSRVPSGIFLCWICPLLEKCSDNLRVTCLGCGVDRVFCLQHRPLWSNHIAVTMLLEEGFDQSFAFLLPCQTFSLCSPS